MRVFDRGTRPSQVQSPLHPAAHSDRRVPDRDTLPSELPVSAPDCGHDFGRLRVYPEPSRAPATSSIPVLGEDEDKVEAPNGGTGPVLAPAPAPAAPAGDACSTPLSMNKVTSGPFQNGLSLDDYYPDLVGRGYWSGGATAGTFDTGSRVGGKAQLFGTISGPCDPARFSLAQSVTRTRDRINGVTDPTEGQTFDDIAKSGRDASRAPFRQDWLGGGYNISMADPPSIGYRPTTNAEWDRSFTTSLIGPGGRRSVNWSLSIRVVNGAVTRRAIS